MKPKKSDRANLRWFVASLFAGLALLGVSTASADPTYTSFFDVFVDISLNGTTTGDWLQVPIPPGDNYPILNLMNNSGSPVTLSDAGFFISPTMIPLDDLNSTYEPPTGSPGSPYTPLPQYDGTSINSKGSVPIDLPDSSPTLSLFAMAAAGLLVWQRRSQPKNC